jgi:hypothetical protein
MRRLGTAGLVLALALGASAVLGQSPQEGKTDPGAGGGTPRGSWFGGRFSADKPAPPVKRSVGTTPADRLAELDRLMNAYWRRTAVCDRLAAIAWETNNPALEQEAQRLTELSFQVYQQQAARLLGGAAAMSIGPSARDTLSGASPAGRRDEAQTARVPEGKR